MPTLYRIFGTLRLYKYKKVDSTLSFHLMRPSHCLTFKNRQRKAHNEYINILHAHNHILTATIKTHRQPVYIHEAFTVAML